MFYFDFWAFIRYNFRSFFLSRGQVYRLTPKRFLVLVIWLLIFIPGELMTRLFLLLDEILYWKYRQQTIKNPVFIIGNPRSGTTFLHRLLFKDTGTFTSLTVWEMIFAPSITQRKIIWGLTKLGKLAGYPFNRLLKRINRKINKEKSGHSVKLDEAEEDEFLLMHSWSSNTLWAFYPIKEEVLPYFFFDRDIPEKRKKKINAFYKSLIQRHLYAHGGDKILLSKNPSFTGKIASLSQMFPDARFINLARNPYEAMPSMYDYMSTAWHVFCDSPEAYPFTDEFFKVMNYYYLFPADFFKEKPEKCNFIEYADMVSNPFEIVESLYAWLGFEFSDDFRRLSQIECDKASAYHSPHQYSAEQMGLTQQTILERFAEVFSYYEFDTHQIDLPDRVMLWQIREWPKHWKTQRLARKTIRQQKRQARKSLRKSKKKGNA